MHPYVATTQVKEAWDTKGDMKKEREKRKKEKRRKIAMLSYNTKVLERGES